MPQALQHASRQSHISFAAEESAKFVPTSRMIIEEDAVSKTIKADLHVLKCLSA
jgi:hypothetical protein